MKNTFGMLAIMGAIAAMPAFAQTAPATPATDANSTRATTPITQPADAGSSSSSMGASSGTSPANGPMPPAVATDTMKNKTDSAPVKGHNSFTQRQAKKRIVAKGYSDVSGLTKDHDGIWRGKAMKDGKSVDVALDYQGNVTGD